MLAITDSSPPRGRRVREHKTEYWTLAAVLRGVFPHVS